MINLGKIWVNRQILGLSKKHKWLVYILAFIVLAVVLRPPMGGIGHDQAIYMLFGKQIVEGNVVYKDIWDNKGPVVYFVFAFIFEAVGYSLLVVNIFGTLCVLLLGIGIYLLTTQIADRSAGRYAFFILLLGAVFPFAQVFNSEIIMELFIVFGLLGVLVGLRREKSVLILLGGIAVGFALQTKGVAVFDAVAPVVLIVLFSKRQSGLFSKVVGVRLLWLFTGMALPTVLFVGYFAYHHALADFVACTVLYNFGYIGTGEGTSFTHSLVSSLQKVVLPSSGFWILGIFGLVAILLPIRNLSDQVKQRGSSMSSALRVTLTVWLVGAIVGVLVGRRFYPHYYMQLAPVTAVLGGIGIGWLLRECRTNCGHLARSILLTMAVLIVLCMLPRLGPAIYKWRGSQIWSCEAERLGIWLDQHAESGEYVFVWPLSAQPYLLSDIKPACRFFSPWYDPWPPEQKKQDPRQVEFYKIWQQDMAAADPQWIALGRESSEDQAQGQPERQFLVEWLRPDYVWYAEVAGYDVYRRAGRR